MTSVDADYLRSLLTLSNLTLAPSCNTKGDKEISFADGKTITTDASYCVVPKGDDSQNFAESL